MSNKPGQKIGTQAELRQGLHITSIHPFDDPSDNPFDNPLDGDGSSGSLFSYDLTLDDQKASTSRVDDHKMNGSLVTDQRKGGGEAEVTESPLGYDPFEGYTKRSFIKKYGEPMKKFFPVRCVSPKDKEIPIHNSGMLSLFTFHWITKFMWHTFRKGFLDEASMWTCTTEESAEVNGRRFARLWAEELKRKNGIEKASLGWVLFRFMRTMLIVATILNFISVTFSFIGPALLFRLLLDYTRSSETNLTYGLTLTFTLCIAELGRSLTQLSHMFFGYLLGMRVRAATMYLIFHKILRLRSVSKTSVGEVVNFFANDCQRFLELATFSSMVLSGPVTAIAGTIYCVLYIGPWALLGAAVILLYYPYQAFISKLTTYVRKKAIVVTDKRHGGLENSGTCNGGQEGRECKRGHPTYTHSSSFYRESIKK